MGMPEIIEVAAAALRDEQGRILIARRPDDAHQGGLWEFPGGKRHPEESFGDCLLRELDEELGITATGYRPLIRLAHDYGDRHVLLDVWLVDTWEGEPRGREGQPLAWVEPDALRNWPMPAADVPVVSALCLPDRYLITPDPEGDPQALLRRLQVALHNGIRLVQLRTRNPDSEDYLSLARDVVDLCHAHASRVLLNADPELVERSGADGVHLSSLRLRAMRERPLPADKLVAASCHDRDELQHAKAIGASFALLSPVLPTASHPGVPGIGWEGFARTIEDIAMPVYALGGVSAAHLPIAWQHGAQGVAGIRGFMPTEQPA